MRTAEEEEILALTHRLLTSIGQRDWAAYEALCDPGLTCFEPESRGALVEGLDFHRYYFDLARPESPRQDTVCAPMVRMLGPDAAVVAYVRLVQRIDSYGLPHTDSFEETRVWRRTDGGWKHVHFHRSSVS